MQVIGDDYDDVKHPNLPFQALDIAIDIANKRRRYLQAQAAAARKKSKMAQAAAARKKENMVEAADAGKDKKEVRMFVIVMSIYFTSVFFNTIVVCN